MTEERNRLWNDVRLFGDMLGNILHDQEGDALFGVIEELRQVAVESRGKGQVPMGQLKALLKPLADEDLLTVARAFSQFLNLANIAEQRHRVRLFREHEDYAGEMGANRRLGDMVADLLAQGIQPQQLRECLSRLSVELVMTAHPTEVTRRTLIRKYDWLIELLGERERSDLSHEQQKRLGEKTYQTLLACWRTDEIRRQHPTPLDEAKWGFATVEQSLWHAVPLFMRELDEVARTHLGGSLDAFHSPVRFASWMGGDRDGNPNVTAEVTHQVLASSRWMAADLYLRDINGLLADLAMPDASDELQQQVGNSHEPYRALLRHVRERLQNTRSRMAAILDNQPLPHGAWYQHESELRDALNLIDRSLRACGMAAIAEGELKNTRWRLDAFGITLLTLDIRQESDRHTEVLSAVCRYLELGDYAEWPEEKRQAFLIEQLESKRPLIDRYFYQSDTCTNAIREVLVTCQLIAEQKSQGLGAYVISMARQGSDILAVYLLQRIAGVETPLRVVPLFETLDDLERAPEQMHELLQLPWYRQQVQAGQEIMIGYSDSAKDAGYLAAAWAQYQAQAGLTDVFTQAKIPLTLFHGRGGSISRGGSPTRMAVLSQPPGAVDGRIRVTEQGEVIRFKYGVPDVAVSHLEQYVGAVLEATLQPPAAPGKNWQQEMARLTATSMQYYRQTVQQDPQLVPYLRTVTPEQELSRFALGSRPARRQSSGGVESLRAIPWVFAWTQMRLLLPAWLGTGKALAESLADSEREKILRDMIGKWPFFQGMIDKLEVSVAKADLSVASYYEQRLANSDELRAFGARLHQDFQHVCAQVQQLTGHRDPLENNPTARWSIDVRNPYTDPLHLLQAELMARLRQADGNQQTNPTIERALMVTIAGIAAGLRNTG